MSTRRGVTCALLFALGVVPVARAHDARPGVLALEALGDGSYLVRWTEPVDARRPEGSVRPVFPSTCVQDGPRLRCEAPLVDVAFEGLEDARVFVRLRERDGSLREAWVDAEAPRAHLEPTAFFGWVWSGVEHVLLGFDHVAFVLGLLLVVGFAAPRRLLLTITAFTLAHSVTLALASLQWLQLPSAPVEATIAASIVLVAREAGSRERSWTRELPWLVAACFGLVHGLGFAGALADVGLPEDGWAAALFGFNVGVELGQLLVVAAAGLVALAASRLPAAPREHGLTLARYALGTLGAFWCVERVVGMFG
ncbi:MAG: HupE/UreJ family protein [Polyangiales bacterium]|nr:HupE/UreJ family protein [Sandaracinus sp.]